jgi:hypothetical protein
MSLPEYFAGALPSSMGSWITHGNAGGHTGPEECLTLCLDWHRGIKVHEALVALGILSD